MDRSTQIFLIAKTQTRDKNGVFHSAETKRAVFCNVRSASQEEFSKAGRNGLNPAFVFRLFRFDYQNEPVVEYDGQRFAVYRTQYATRDYLALYTKREGGTNG